MFCYFMERLACMLTVVLSLLKKPLNYKVWIPLTFITKELRLINKQQNLDRSECIK